jgi:tRNA pseudouridine55 synthase
MDKVYRAGVLLGAGSDTDDADGRVTTMDVATPPSAESVQEELAHFIGAIDQVPPNFSAIKVTGRRAYDLARRGDKVALAERTVRIYDIKQLHYAYPHLELEVRCGKGTYIRSLARDLGQRLGCGGLISTLRRLRIGPFSADLAVSLDAVTSPALLPLAMAAAELPALTLEPQFIQSLRQGRAVPLPAVSASFEEEAVVAIFGEEKALVGIGKVVKKQVRPLRILAHS